MKVKNFRDLNIWQKGIEIVKSVYIMVKDFPKQEIYSLTAQMRRCAVSIPSNIAEGFNRFHTKEYKHFLFIALGSCAELETQIEISCELKYIDNQKKEDILTEIQHESRMIMSLIKKLNTSI